jgi:hypothetical protein
MMKYAQLMPANGSCANTPESKRRPHFRSRLLCVTYYFLPIFLFY